MAEKLALAKRTQRVFPAGIPESECDLSHARPVWRLEENRAILIAYEIDCGPKNPYGIIPGVLGRSEYGQEICVAIAHLVYLTGLTFGNVCQVFDLPPMEGAADDRRLLLNEMGRLLLAEQLFTFVTAPPAAQPNGETHPVAGTNNESERTLRNPAEARDTGRTNKTSAGTRWRTIVTSVLESLRLDLPKEHRRAIRPRSQNKRLLRKCSRDGTVFFHDWCTSRIVAPTRPPTLKRF
jgi:hypothetical protein